ncbi:MAG: DUF2971 domain-containing protein [Prevotella sp.]|nr:DUF2971 domain-containing protein [Prevotella sp.]
MSNESVYSSNAVYHYTALTNLENILREDGVKLWATRYGFLNDKREFVWANQVIQPELEKIAKQNGEVFDPERRVHPYILSFCDVENDPVMWRLYGNDGAGVCLTFDINEMGIHKEKMMAHMAVVYTNESNLREAIESAHRIYQQEDANVKFADDYREVAAFIKHKDYEIEQEYRVVKFVGDGFCSEYDPTKESNCEIKDLEYSEEIKFRPRGNMLIPYVEIMLPKTSLKEVHIGYNCNYKSTKRAIELLSDLRGYNIRITKSSINNFTEK